MEVDQAVLAQSQLWSHVFSYVKPMSLKCAIRLGIPNIIHRHGEPIPLSILATSIPVPCSKMDQLRRMMRLLSHSGIFKADKNCDGNETYSLTPCSTLLIDHGATGLSPFALLILDASFIGPWHSIDNWFRSDDSTGTSFAMAHGANIWDHARRCSQFNHLFNEGLTCDSQLIMRFVVDNYNYIFRGARSLVDVGGNEGAVAQVISDAFPELSVLVFDLPHVVANLHRNERIMFVAGDMFKSVPAADIIFLKLVLHDWSDEECVKILQNCRQAVPSKDAGGKVVILEMVMCHTGVDAQLTEMQYSFDAFIMALTSGKERDEQQWKTIFNDAGFEDYKITPVQGIRSLIELYRID